MNPLKRLKAKKFSCIKCGECCNSWKIPVEEDVCNSLLAQEWVKSLFSQNEISFQSKNGEFLLPQRNKVCIFYDSEKQICKIQANNCFAIKPRECKRFPFAFIQDSSGKLFVDTSFYCKSILNNEGILLSDYIDDEVLLDFDIFKLPDQLSLFHKHKIENDKLELIIEKIILCLYQRLSQQRIEHWYKPMIGIFTIFQSLKKTPTSKINANYLNNIFSAKQIDITCQKIIKPNLDYFTALILWKKHFLLDFYKLIRSKNNYYDYITTETINLSSLKKTNFNDDEEIKELFLRYLIDILERKALFAHGHTLESVFCTMITAYCLVYFYSQLFSTLINKTNIEKFSVEMAIRCTERYYIGHNVKFLERFRNHFSCLFYKSLLVG